MATGIIKEYKGPFSSGESISIPGFCRIGMSIGEDEYMIRGTEVDIEDKKSFRFELTHGQTGWRKTQVIEVGRTYIYETQEQVYNPTISFPDGAPLSTIVDVVY